MTLRNSNILPNGFNPTSKNPNSMHLRSIYNGLIGIFADRFLWSNLRWANIINEGLFWAMNNKLTENNIQLSTSYEDLNKKNNWSDRWVDEYWFYNLFSSITSNKDHIRKLFIFSSALLPTEWFTYYSLPDDFSKENKITSGVFWAYCLGIRNTWWGKFYTFLEFDSNGDSKIHTHTDSWGGDAWTIYNPSARTITFQDTETD